MYIYIYQNSSHKKIPNSPSYTVLLNVLVLSRIDYSSSLLYHLPNNSVSPLNSIIRASI